jgi:murein tripeptide amidase MpaA
VLGVSGATATLAIRRDAHSDFFQWFHFRVSGAQGRQLVLKITGLNASAYPLGWPGYRACVSADRQNWTRAETHWDAAEANGTLTITHTAAGDPLWLPISRPIRWSATTISWRASPRGRALPIAAWATAWMASR